MFILLFTFSVLLIPTVRLIGNRAFYQFFSQAQDQDNFFGM